MGGLLSRGKNIAATVPNTAIIPIKIQNQRDRIISHF